MSYQLKLWDSKRERKLTGPNTLPAVHRTKGPSKSREELAGCRPAQPCRRLAVGVGGKGAGSAPRTASPTALQTGLQFLIKDPRFWMVDTLRERRGETQGTGTRPAWVGTRAGDAEGRRHTHTTDMGRK